MQTQPEFTQLVDIMNFVEGLIDRDQPSPEQGLRPISDRYPIDFEHMINICNTYATSTMYLVESRVQSMKKQGEEYDFPQMVHQAILAAAIRMYAFASEYNRRYVLPDMIEGFNSDLAEMESGRSSES